MREGIELLENPVKEPKRDIEAEQLNEHLNQTVGIRPEDISEGPYVEYVPPTDIERTFSYANGEFFVDAHDGKFKHRIDRDKLGDEVYKRIFDIIEDVLLLVNFGDPNLVEIKVITRKLDKM